MTFTATEFVSAGFVVAALGWVLFLVVHRARSNRSISSNRTPLVPGVKTEQSVPARYPGKFHVRYWQGPDGRPASSENKAAWLEARRTGVTATDVRKLANLEGQVSEQRAELLAAKLNGDEHQQRTTAAMQYGLDRESAIAAWVLQEFGIEHNIFLCRGINGRHLATPDGIGDGVICEIKTSTRSRDVLAVYYRDQLQWQLHVTSSARVLFVVENRDTHVIEWGWVVRDEARIAVLVRHADLFIADLDSRR